ncbi:MAG: carbohydrate binding family 9 domain-containing protein [Candidatus Aminicenantes bacterium]|nr:MAG: carbohydrate binding family 9 domain-containing protein [Candidatus Aminicenantes bacterium]
MNYRTIVTVLSVLCVVSGFVYSETPGMIVLQRIEGPITLDGVMDEPGWKNIEPFPFIQHAPNFAAEPTERTAAFVAHDDEYLYLAGHLYDSEPSKILDATKQRDTQAAATDFFGIVIDSFCDKENGLAFFTTPTGLRWDATIANDGVTDRPDMPPFGLSWDTFWDVAVTRNKEGWFAEFRIPFSSLRFQDEEGRVTMGIIIWRWIARKNEIVVFPAISPDSGAWSMVKPSLSREVIMEEVHSKKPLYITPYALGGHGRAYELNDAETEYLRQNDPVFEAGLDIKYGISSNFTADITVNTDFAQVEADDVQVNLTRFSLFFPEKRRFFLERASTFEFRFGGPNLLFYSRRIGINEDTDELVRIYGGARLVGRVGGWDLGFLNMQTAKSEGIPSENFGIFRVRRRVFNPFSYVGGMITSRIGMDGRYNVAYGLDGIFRVFGDDYLTVNWAQTFENDAANEFLSLDPAKFRFNWERRTLKGFGYDLGISRAGEDYNPGMGFEMREDYIRFGDRLFYAWIPSAKSFLRLHQVFLRGYLTLQNSDSTTESAEFGPGWAFETNSGWGGSIQPKLYAEYLEENFELTDEVEVPPGEYTFYGVEGNLITPMGRTLSLMPNFKIGSFYDGWRISAGTFYFLNLSSTWQLSGFYEFNRVEFPDRDQEFTAHIARLKILATFTTKISASAFIQYNGAEDIVVANVRFRYNPREGNDFYIVYNHGVNTDRYRGLPHRPFTDNRAILIKYTYTFNVK